ncbi:helix-turn-helix domain-containing protein [Oceanobacillus rekensis]|uniref:helix-turn-helix domain-containing protein n=1 Tax=Oceanobacillus rekensis TaxID=937927 RepID=UPI000B433295|nr:helix-turn-helix domain-containing protein [Oceanobacillus rekensis]
MSQNQVSTLRKGLLVLESVKQNQGITLTELMKELQLSKSTAFRLLTTLEEMNYIYKIGTQYFFNPKMFSEGLEKRSIKDWVSLRSIYQVAQKLQMSTYLGKVDGTDLVMTQVLHAPFHQAADEEIGNRSRLHLSALAIAAPAEQISRSNIKHIATKLDVGSKTVTK